MAENQQIRKKKSFSYFFLLHYFIFITTGPKALTENPNRTKYDAQIQADG